MLGVVGYQVWGSVESGCNHWLFRVWGSGVSDMGFCGEGYNHHVCWGLMQVWDSVVCVMEFWATSLVSGQLILGIDLVSEATTTRNAKIWWSFRISYH